MNTPSITPDEQLPDGSPFAFWEDATRYVRTYHVDCRHPEASDDNPGTEARPFLTVGRAAALLEPGEEVVIHEGRYRECVRPARGGTGPDRMIRYRAAPGATVCLLGSEAWQPAFVPSRGWRMGHADASYGPASLAHDLKIWTAELPAEWFCGYNPFAATNVNTDLWAFVQDWTPEEIQVFVKRRGLLWVDDRALQQVLYFRDLSTEPGTFWVEEPGGRIHLRFWEDADPNGTTFEVTVREQVFAPLHRNLGYVRVSGLNIERAANGFPVPQRGLLSTRQGHHWILEDCTVRHANSVGIDIGLETWHAEEKADPAENGGHIVRRNRVTDCGICGIAGAFNADDCLIENNLLEHIGGRHIERLYETGGMKLHRAARTLIRGNVFRRVRHAPGLWLDYLCRNTRVTGNLFCDIESLKGAVYLEVAQEPNLIDRNVIWDIRMAPYPPDGKFYGHGINVDTGDESILAHNLIGNIQRGHGIAVRLTQPRRQTAGRVGLGRRHTIANNILVNCPERVILSRAEDNRCDGNVYDDGSDALAYCIEFPEPRAAVNLEAWQHFLGFDREACVSRLRVELDADSRELTVELPQALPLRDPVPVPADTPARRVPAGPMPFAVGRHAYRLCPDAPA